MTDFMEVQLIGGPYDGRLVVVGTNTVDQAGDPAPANLVYSCPDPTLPQALIESPGAEKVLGEDPRRQLTYDRQHRGDRWVYVLRGVGAAGLPEETDPILAALIQHIRREWPNRLYFTAGERVPRYAHEEYGQDEEDMVSDETTSAEVRLIKRAPADTARIMFETIKQAVDECDPDERFELVHEIYDWALTAACSCAGDAHTAYLVCLDDRIRDDEAQRTLGLLMAIRHVISVEPVPADDEYRIAQTQERYRLHQVLLEALR